MIFREQLYVASGPVEHRELTPVKAGLPSSKQGLGTGGLSPLPTATSSSLLTRHFIDLASTVAKETTKSKWQGVLDTKVQ